MALDAAAGPEVEGRTAAPRELQRGQGLGPPTCGLRLLMNVPRDRLTIRGGDVSRETLPARVMPLPRVRHGPQWVSRSFSG